jgi:CHASE2 domain-containing sensor protein
MVCLSRCGARVRIHAATLRNGGDCMQASRIWSGATNIGRMYVREGVALIMAAILLLFIEYLPQITNWLGNAGARYQLFITAGPRELMPRYTTLIEIAYPREPANIAFINVCEQREFLARLLRVVAEGSPAVVVVDKYFNSDVCAARPEAHAALADALRVLTAKRIPAIVGRFISNQNVLDPALPLGQEVPGVQEAAINFHPQVQRIAFEWWPMNPATNAQEVLPTVPWAAAVARSPRLVQDSRRVRKYYSRNRSPFVSLLPMSSFEGYRHAALQILCGTTDSHVSWRSCATPSADTSAQLLRGRVVLIGESTAGLDQHATDVGYMPGVMLQANLVEALLDGRLFTPVPAWINLLITATVLLVIEWRLRVVSGATLLIVLIFIVLFYVVAFAIVQVGGLYLNPGLFAIAALVSRLLRGASDHMMKIRGGPVRTIP